MKLVRFYLQVYGYTAAVLMVIGILALLLGGCASQATSMSRYVEMPPPGKAFEANMRWVVTEDAEKICDKLYGKPLIGKHNACVVPARSDAPCTLYTRGPRSEDDRIAIYVLGHEALHCFIGEFHR